MYLHKIQNYLVNPKIVYHVRSLILLFFLLNLKRLLGPWLWSMVYLFQASSITPVDSGFRSDLSEYSASQLLSRSNESLVNQVYYPAMKDFTGSCTMLKQNLSVVS